MFSCLMMVFTRHLAWKTIIRTISSSIMVIQRHEAWKKRFLKNHYNFCTQSSLRSYHQISFEINYIIYESSNYKRCRKHVFKLGDCIYGHDARKSIIKQYFKLDHGHCASSSLIKHVLKHDDDFRTSSCLWNYHQKSFETQWQNLRVIKL